MALVAPPPWTSVHPLDFVNAASSGAKLGLEKAQQDAQALDAADRIKVAYAQIQQQAQQAAMAHQAAMQNSAVEELRNQSGLEKWKEEQGRLNDQFHQQQALRQQHESAVEANAADRLKSGNAAKTLHVGNGVYTYDPKNGKLSTLLEPQPAADPYDRVDYGRAAKLNGEASKKLADLPKTDPDRPLWEKQYQDTLDEMARIKDKRKPINSLGASPEAPLGWKATTGGEWLRPVLPPMAAVAPTPNIYMGTVEGEPDAPPAASAATSSGNRYTILPR